MKADQPDVPLCRQSRQDAGPACLPALRGRGHGEHSTGLPGTEGVGEDLKNQWLKCPQIWWKT